ncbi:PREDICTED: neuropeptide Y receptor type 5-like [Branchiostoma belcheri]|uniref:Neuropeptide Y receptor type 5-like n=1 Tax=Branchiostoma belcheri TaxID=7741 RepID=A0A6P4ZMJ2_BRABE|nr:PREDICTED: neuropeptide Y receptor type 5-like [Branchiostoma belcheri]
MNDTEYRQDVNMTEFNFSTPWLYTNESDVHNRSLVGTASTLSVASQSALIIFYGAATFLSLVGNSMVVLVLTRDALKRTDLNVYLINLAFADITMAVFCMPFSFTEVMLQGWIWGEVMCPLMRFSQQTSVLVSIFTLVTIGVDRYYGVVHPLMIRVTKTRARLIVVLIWVVSSGLAIPQLAISRQVVYSYGNRCEEVWAGKYEFGYTIAFMIVSYALPVVILCGTYLRIGTELWGKAPADVGRVDDNNQARQRKKIIKMLCTVVSMFVVSWLPLHVFRFILDLHPNFVYDNPDRSYIFFFCAHWLAMSHSFMNPIVYSFMNDRFRNELCHLLRQMVACQRARQHPAIQQRRKKTGNIEMVELKNPPDTNGSMSQSPDPQAGGPQSPLTFFNDMEGRSRRYTR